MIVDHTMLSRIGLATAVLLIYCRSVFVLPLAALTSQSRAIVVPLRQPQEGQQIRRSTLLSYPHDSPHTVDDGSPPPQVLALTTSQKDKNVIVYLTQRKRHSTYHHRDPFSLFLKSLRLLYDNYLSHGSNAENVDLYVLHTGDFLPEDYWLLYDCIGGLDILKLVNIGNTSYWKLPSALEGEDVANWRYSGKKGRTRGKRKSAEIDFSLGYRHMCRFMSIGIWDFFGTYKKYVWRLDEDSFVHSSISYNMFDYMEQRDYVYGYRLCTYEMWEIFTEWQAFASITPPMRPITPDKEESAMYNNFFVARVSFFRSPAVQAWLNHTDHRQLAYRQRLGDLLVHSAAVYAFAPPHQVHRFLDFTYQHMTLAPDPESNQAECPIWGGLQAGYNDDNAEELINQLQREYANCTRPWRVQVLDSNELSPTYNGLNPQANLTLKGFFAGSVEASKGRGLKSG
jgi:hypothetical protein